MDVPMMMDTGGNKRWASDKLSKSWKSSAKSGISYYKYTGVREGTTNNQTYNLGTLPGATVTSSNSRPTLAPISKIFKL